MHVVFYVTSDNMTNGESVLCESVEMGFVLFLERFSHTELQLELISFAILLPFSLPHVGSHLSFDLNNECKDMPEIILYFTNVSNAPTTFQDI